MLSKNTLAVKKCEANQKQDSSYSYKQPKSLISGKAKKKSFYLNDMCAIVYSQAFSQLRLALFIVQYNHYIAHNNMSQMFKA